MCVEGQMNPCYSETMLLMQIWEWGKFPDTKMVGRKTAG